MAFDSNRGVIVLFGGAFSTVLNDTWEWDGANWAKRIPKTIPAARTEHVMAYDSARCRTVMFGGTSSETWEWDGVDWTRSVTRTAPLAHRASAMIFDSNRKEVVVFGGYYVDSSGYFPTAVFAYETWGWDGADWKNRTPIGTPPPHLAPTMSYDGSRAVTVMYLGSNAGYCWDAGGTWEFDGTLWMVRDSPSVPPALRWSHAMAYDPLRAVTVLFGGYDDFSDTWEWNGTTWTERTPASSPSERGGAAMVFDEVRGVTVLFGGLNLTTGMLNDTWSWNGNTWTLRAPAAKPSIRAAHAMAYDSARGVSVLFGGTDNVQTFGDTWEWNGTNWIQRTPANSPPARYYSAMAYDTTRGVIVLFGGHDGTFHIGDTWEWDGVNWTERLEVARPSVRATHALTYDRARGVAVLYGGVSHQDVLADTWAFGLLPPNPDSDVNVNGTANGMDVSRFVTAILSGSTMANDLCHADFNANGVIDEGDLPGFLEKALGL
jgi:hypothetical protein